MTWLTDRRIILLLVLLQIGLCLPFINSFSIDLDEPFTVFWAQQDLDVMFEMFENENNPPLYFVLLHFWVKLFGIGPIAVRLLSLVFSVLTIPVLFNFSKKIVGVKFAVLASLFFIFSTFNHYHALEARTYSLLVLLVVLAFSTLYNILFDSEKHFWKLALWNGLLLYTHYLAPFIIGCEAIIFLMFFKYWNLRKLGLVSLSVILSLLIYTPGIIVFLKRLEHFAGSGTWVHDPHVSEVYGNIIRFSNGLGTLELFGAGIILLLFLQFTHFKNNLLKTMSKANTYFLITAFLLPYLGMFAFSKLVQPVFLDRYLLFTTPFLFVLYAFIIKLFSSELYSWVVVLAFTIPMSINCVYYPDNNRDADVMAEYLQSEISENDQVLVAPLYYDLTFLYHFDTELFKDYLDCRWEGCNNFRAIYTKDAIQVSPEAEHVFYVDAVADYLYPANGIKDSLNQIGTMISQREFKGGHIIYQYELD